MNAKNKFFVDTAYAFFTFSFMTFIRFLRKPILARYLGPEGMGLFSMITIITGMVERFASLGIPAALIKYSAETKDGDKINELLSSAYISMLLIGFLSSLLMIIFSETIANFFGIPNLSLYLKIYAIATPFSFLYSINLSFFNGKREMKKYSYLEVVKSTINFILILFLLYSGYDLIGVLIGSIFALLIALYISLKMLYGKVSFSFKNFYASIKKLVSFGLKVMFAGTINLLNYEADILLIGYFLAAQDVGYYSVAIS
ncbi:MAG: oligosaccharide flippase family protein, partial [Candidatus Thermoplasmatota archaeon]|nr:oligosaccharide flippase family protein [Candidatus Thermoplasmatota archaeon]